MCFKGSPTALELSSHSDETVFETARRTILIAYGLHHVIPPTKREIAM
jgi:hypothetical protein